MTAERHLSPDGRVVLERTGLARGRAVLDGDVTALAPLSTAPGWPTPDTADGLRLTLEHARSDDDTGFLVIEAATERIIGDCGWKGGADQAGDVEIGYGLAASARGRGLGTQLVRTLTGLALELPGALRVTAEVRADNLPSRRALERTGFVLDRVEEETVWYARSGSLTEPPP